MPDYDPLKKHAYAMGRRAKRRYKGSAENMPVRRRPTQPKKVGGSPVIARSASDPIGSMKKAGARAFSNYYWNNKKRNRRKFMLGDHADRDV